MLTLSVSGKAGKAPPEKQLIFIGFSRCIDSVALPRPPFHEGVRDSSAVEQLLD